MINCLFIPSSSPLSKIRVRGGSSSTNNFLVKRNRLLKTQLFLSTTAEQSQSTDIDTERVITLTSKAMTHLTFLKSKQDQGSDMILRMGVRAGGCSGMSYIMDFIKSTDITDDDHIEICGDGIKCAVDPKSLMFLYGLQLDYSDELIGGGFKFSNPNAEGSCGCGKSFNV